MIFKNYNDNVDSENALYKVLMDRGVNASEL